MPDTPRTDANAASALRSMTGFASVGSAVGDWQISGDIRAVNGRGLDLRLRVPDWIDGLEPGLRKLVQSKVGRGSVTVSLRVQKGATTSGSNLNSAGLDAALEMIAAISAAADTKGVAVTAPTAAEVAQLRGVLDQGDVAPEDVAALRAAILREIEASLVEFDADRAREGAALAEVLTDQVEEIEHLVGAARAALGDRAEAAKAAMARALARVTDATDSVDADRIAQELAMLAVKADVAEELDRLGTHIAAARELMATSGPVGRKLDFLMQEFNREANTLCSKSQSTALTSIGLDLKAVIDQMREQVQNVE